jgi:hypothetical protein
MQTSVPDASLLEKFLPGVVIRTRIDRPAVLLGKDRTALLPELAGTLPLRVLDLLVLSESRHDRG